MRHPFLLVLFLALPLPAFAQSPEPEHRYGVRQNTDLYPQDTPKKMLTGLVHILEKQRFDYLVAYMLEPGYVEDQLRITYPKFEKLAREQVQSEKLEQKGFSREYIRARITQLASEANFDYLTRRVKAKIEDDGDITKELKRIARQGDINDAGDTAVARLMEIKDRTIYMRKITGSWYIENRFSDEKVGE